MTSNDEKLEIVKKLQREINLLQGLGKPLGSVAKSKVGLFEEAFPDRVFPIGTVHEFLSHEPAHAASTNGFMAALASTFLNRDGICLWIGRNRKLFPPGLTHFGIKPEHVIFIDLHKQQDLLWTIEEALKCDGLALVVGEIKELGFTESRRLQLAVERSGVTGFIHRYNPKSVNSVACTARWRVRPQYSFADDDLPGIGHTSWNVELLKVRNGRPGSWQIAWSGNGFHPVPGRRFILPTIEERQAG